MHERDVAGRVSAGELAGGRSRSRAPEASVTDSRIAPASDGGCAAGISTCSINSSAEPSTSPFSGSQRSSDESRVVMTSNACRNDAGAWL